MADAHIPADQLKHRQRENLPQTTPLYYPPWFPSYEAFRAHINALVERREVEVRRG